MQEISLSSLIINMSMSYFNSNLVYVSFSRILLFALGLLQRIMAYYLDDQQMYISSLRIILKNASGEMKFILCLVLERL